MTTGDRIQALLPATSAQLRALIGCSRPIMHKWITRLRAARQIRIGSWLRTIGDFAPVFVLVPEGFTGRIVDARRPKPYSMAEVRRRYVSGLKELGLWEDEIIKMRKRRARLNPPKVSFSSDPILAALFPRANPKAGV